MNTRRHFLGQTLAAAAGTFGLAAFGQQLRPEGENIQFGLCTYLWGADWDVPTLIANLKTLKRPELFIDIAKELAASGNITFKMIGRNNASYVKLIREAEEALPRFKYLGELKNTEVNEVLCSADILVNTSDYEGFSNTFVQAWMRKVVVISMNSNPDDILTKQGIGFICPEVKEAASKIRELADHPALITAMGEKAFGYAREHHSVEKNLQKILNLMDI